VNKLRHVVLIEDRTWLFAVGMDIGNRDFSETHTRDLHEVNPIVNRGIVSRDILTACRN
jgi:hypothetical protein